MDIRPIVVEDHGHLIASNRVGYEIQIRRPAGDISLEGWTSVVNGDPELKLTGVAESSPPDGQALRLTSSGLTLWSGHPEGDRVWLHWSRGEIGVKNPDPHCFAKMHALASILGATLEGEEGESYDAHGNMIPPPSVSALDRFLNFFKKRQATTARPQR